MTLKRHRKKNKESIYESSLMTMKRHRVKPKSGQNGATRWGGGGRTLIKHMIKYEHNASDLNNKKCIRLMSSL
jgi:hypothetical protein